MREIKYRAWDNVANQMYYVGEEELIVFIMRGNAIEADKIIPDESEDGYHVEKLDHLQYLQYTGLKDKYGYEIYEGDITELEVGGEKRRFIVRIKTVIREVVSNPKFTDDTAKVAITGVVFEWNGFELFPCVDDEGQFDNTKMYIAGNIYANPELLEAREKQ